MVEQRFHMPLVAGSNPVSGTNYASIVQWTEHRSSKPGVAGSNPARGTNL